MIAVLKEVTFQLCNFFYKKCLQHLSSHFIATACLYTINYVCCQGQMIIWLRYPTNEGESSDTDEKCYQF